MSHTASIFLLVTDLLQQRRLVRRCRSAYALLFLLPLLSAAAQQSGPDLGQAPRSWVTEAANNEIAVVDRHGMSMHYLSHRVDAKGDTVRDTIESTQGTVARLVQRSGRPLTAEEDAAERSRLQEVLKSPSEFARHHKRDDEERKYTIKLIRLMPDAMLYSYAAGQPQRPGAAGPEVVLDFKPNPAFHPPDTVSELMTGLEGRLWIDAHSHAHCMTRMEARIVKPINLGWGMLAKLYPGGTFVFEQTNAGDGQNDLWVYSHLEEKVAVRELMIKTANMELTMTGSRFERLPEMSYQDAIRKLLDAPLPK